MLCLVLDGLILFRIGDFCTKSVLNNEIYILNVVEAWMLFMGSAWGGGGGGGLAHQNFYILIKALV